MLESITEDQITNASARDPKTSIKETVIDVYLAMLTIKHPDLESNLDDMNKDLWAILDARAEGEALGKMKSVPQGEGLMAFIRLHPWFIRTTDLSLIHISEPTRPY